MGGVLDHKFQAGGAQRAKADMSIPTVHRGADDPTLTGSAGVLLISDLNAKLHLVARLDATVRGVRRSWHRQRWLTDGQPLVCWADSPRVRGFGGQLVSMAGGLPGRKADDREMATAEWWGGTADELGRWPSGPWMEVVLRVARAKDLGSLSRELHLTAPAIAQWRDQFLARGQAGLRRRETDEREMEISRMRGKIGEITMENELLRERARRAEAAHPFAVAEAEAVAAWVSPSAGRQYGLARVCRVLELARSTV